jgi:HAMP domain-containing protein
MTVEGRMVENSKRRLSNLLVKKKLQFKLASIISFLMMSMMISLWLANNWSIAFVMGSKQTNDVVFLGYLHQIRLITLLAGLIIFCANFLFVLPLTHYFAGPVYRFERVFEEMEKGDLSMTVKLRKHDELQETAMALNRAIIGLRKKFEGRT